MTDGAGGVGEVLETGLEVGTACVCKTGVLVANGNTGTAVGNVIALGEETTSAFKSEGTKKLKNKKTNFIRNMIPPSKVQCRANLKISTRHQQALYRGILLV